MNFLYSAVLSLLCLLFSVNLAAAQYDEMYFDSMMPHSAQGKRSDFFMEAPQFKGLRGMRGKRMPYMNLKGLRGKRTF